MSPSRRFLLGTTRPPKPPPPSRSSFLQLQFSPPPSVVCPAPSEVKHDGTPETARQQFVPMPAYPSPLPPSHPAPSPTAFVGGLKSLRGLVTGGALADEAHSKGRRVSHLHGRGVGWQPGHGGHQGHHLGRALGWRHVGAGALLEGALDEWVQEGQVDVDLDVGVGRRGHHYGGERARGRLSQRAELIAALGEGDTTMREISRLCTVPPVFSLLVGPQAFRGSVSE